jgi:hypothetical protein
VGCAALHACLGRASSAILLLATLTVVAAAAWNGLEPSLLKLMRLS